MEITKKVIIYGVNLYTEVIIQTINQEKCKIIACIDYSNNYIGNFIKGIEIISGQQLFDGDYEYDYIINGEPENFTLWDKMISQGLINKDNFFDYLKLLNYTTSISSCDFFRNYQNFINSDKNFEGLITGLSYAQLSIDCSILSKSFFNFANPSQDLFYDFEMMKFVYQYPTIKENLKYVIIGLSYYSFEYDLSVSKNSWRSHYYYPIVGETHHLPEVDMYIYELAFLQELGKTILHSNYAEMIYNYFEERHNKLFNDSRKIRYDFCALNNQEKLKEVEGILQDFDKDYPKTVKENVEILEKYLLFLKRRKIIPIIVISPTTEIYNLLVSKKIKDEFYGIINDLKQRYDFQFLDYCNSDEFEDRHFSDASHMNEDGAIKFTKILEADIQWAGMPLYTQAMKEVICQTLNLLSTLHEVFQHIILLLDNGDSPETKILLKDISQAINNIIKSLEPILTVEANQHIVPYTSNLQQSIDQVYNAYEIADSAMVKSVVINKVIPLFVLWKEQIRQQVRF